MAITGTLHGRDLTGRQIAELLEEFVNAHSRDSEADEFVAYITDNMHRTLQQSFMKVILNLLERWKVASLTGRFDLRNEATVKLAQKMLDATGDRYDRPLPLI